MGLVRVGDAPGSPAARYSVQMGIHVQRSDLAAGSCGARVSAVLWAWPVGRISLGGGAATARWWGTSALGILAMGVYTRMRPPSYVREVSLVLRDTASNQVVYETRAKHESPWADSLNILPAMFDAALQGFPTPPCQAVRQDTACRVASVKVDKK